MQKDICEKKPFHKNLECKTNRDFMTAFCIIDTNEIHYKEPCLNLQFNTILHVVSKYTNSSLLFPVTL